MNRTLVTLSGDAQRIIKPLSGVLVVLLLLPSLIMARMENRPKGEGYFFFAPVAGTASAVHVGGGGERLVYHGLGLGAELGYLSPWSSFGSGGWGVVSPDVSYHFTPSASHPRLEPFVTGGYTVFLNSFGNVSDGVNFGGGVNVWLRKHVGLRLELRDQVTQPSLVFPARRGATGTEQLVDFRIGMTFR